MLRRPARKKTPSIEPRSGSEGEGLGRETEGENEPGGDAVAMSAAEAEELRAAKRESESSLEEARAELVRLEKKLAERENRGAAEVESLSQRVELYRYRALEEECRKWEDREWCLQDRLGKAEEELQTAKATTVDTDHLGEQLQLMTSKLESTDTLVSRLSEGNEKLLHENYELRRESLALSELKAEVAMLRAKGRRQDCSMESEECQGRGSGSLVSQCISRTEGDPSAHVPSAPVPRISVPTASGPEATPRASDVSWRTPVTSGAYATLRLRAASTSVGEGVAAPSATEYPIPTTDGEILQPNGHASSRNVPSATTEAAVLTLRGAVRTTMSTARLGPVSATTSPALVGRGIPHVTFGIEALTTSTTARPPGGGHFRSLPEQSQIPPTHGYSGALRPGSEFELLRKVLLFITLDSK